MDAPETVTLTYGIGIFRIMLWRDHKGEWHYDGPVQSGPREVRKSKRGPNWTGSVSNAFARKLARAIAARTTNAR